MKLKILAWVFVLVLLVNVVFALKQESKGFSYELVEYESPFEISNVKTEILQEISYYNYSVPGRVDGTGGLINFSGVNVTDTNFLNLSFDVSFSNESFNPSNLTNVHLYTDKSALVISNSSFFELIPVNNLKKVYPSIVDKNADKGWFKILKDWLKGKGLESDYQIFFNNLTSNKTYKVNLLIEFAELNDAHFILKWGVNSTTLEFNYVNGSLSSNNVNDVYLGNLNSDSVDYTTWFNDSTSSWWLSANDTAVNSAMLQDFEPSTFAIIPDDDAYTSSKDFTVMYGVYHNTFTGGSLENICVAKGASEFYISTDDNGHMDVQYGSFVNQIAPPGTISPGQWYLFTFTYEQATDTGKLYVNTDLVGQGSAWSVPSNTNANITLGKLRQILTSDYDCDGKIDELYFFNRTISGSEVNATFYLAENHQKSNISTTDLISYHSFDNGFLDNSGNGHDAIEVGTSNFISGKSSKKEFPLNPYFSCNDLGFDIVDGSTGDLWLMNNSFGNCEQVYYSDGSLFLDNGTSFFNYSFKDDVYSGTLSRQDDLYVRDSEYYWSNSSGFCRDNNALDWSFNCDNFTEEQSINDVCADINNVYLARSYGGLSVFNTTTLELTKQYVATTFDTTSPIYWYKLEDTSPEIAGTPSLSTVGTPTSADGKFGNGIKSPFGTNYYELNDANISMNNGSLEFWITFNEAPPVSTSSEIFGGEWTGVAATNKYFNLWHYSGGTWEFEMGFNTDPDRFHKTWTDAAMGWTHSGQKMHVALVWNWSEPVRTDRTKFYFDGKLFTDYTADNEDIGAVQEADVTEIDIVRFASGRGGSPSLNTIDNFKIYDKPMNDWSGRFVENGSVTPILRGSDITSCDSAGSVDLFAGSYGFGVDQLKVDSDSLVYNWTSELNNFNITSLSASNTLFLTGYEDAGMSSTTFNITNITLPSWNQFNLTTLEEVNIVNRNITGNATVTGASSYLVISSSNSSLADCSISSNGLLNVSVGVNASGVSNCVLRVTDIYGSSDTTTYITVSNVNDAPVLSIADQFVTVSSSTEVNLSDYTTDVDNVIPTDMSWNVQSDLDGNITCSIVSEILTITSITSWTGETSCTINVTDGTDWDSSVVGITVQDTALKDYEVSNCGSGVGGLYNSFAWTCQDNITLTTDLTCSGIKTPLCSAGYNGTFDGQGFSINNLVINCSGNDCGLFAKGGSSLPNFDDVNLINISVSNTGTHTGGLIGKNPGNISNVFITGVINSSSSFVGGITGYTTNNIGTSSFNGYIIGTNTVGGLAGHVKGSSVIDSNYTGVIRGVNNVGGIAGLLGSSIVRSFAIVDINSTSWWVGGLVGRGAGEIIDSYAKGSVQGLMFVGGLIGSDNGAYSVDSSYFIGKVIGDDDVGGISGGGSGTLNNSFTVSNITCTNSDCGSVGGDGSVSFENVYWNNMTGNFDYCYNDGLNPSGCNAISDNVSYFKNELNQPLLNWDFTTVWSVDPLINDGYPYLLAPLTMDVCVVNLTNSSMPDYVAMLRMGDVNNTHAQLLNSSDTIYPYTLFCTADGNPGVEISNSSGIPFIRLSNETNAHVENPYFTNYGFEALVNVTGVETFNVSVKSECNVGEIGMLSFLNETGGQSNAHIAEYGYYSNQVCLNITYDVTGPFVNITYPVNDTVYILPILNLNYTVSDTNLDSCWYTNSTGQNVSLPGCSNTVFIPIVGNNNITVYANDTAGNIGSDNVSFTYYVDLIPPNVTDLRPVAGSVFVVNTSIEIGANITDNDGKGAMFANLTYPNGTVELLNLSLAGTDIYNTTFDIPVVAGVYNVTFIANDLTGNVNNTETTWFLVRNLLSMNLTNLTYFNIAEDTYNDTINLNTYTNYTGFDTNLAWSCLSSEADVIPTIFSNSWLNISATNDYFGIVNISCSVTDTVETNSSSFLVNVTPVNDAPVLNFINQTVSLNTTKIIELMDYTTDIDNIIPDDMTWTLISENALIADCTIVGTTLQVEGVGVGNSSCVINVTDGSLSDQEPQYISVIIPILNITEVQSGIDWSRIKWSGPSCPT